MNKKFYNIVLFLLALSSQIFASGNIYSRYGIGDLHFSYSARRLAMGELGIATRDFDYLNSLNPASWTQLRLTRFETGATFKGNNISSNEGEAFHSQTIFSGLMLGFPIDYSNGISFVAGLLPYSNVDYELSFNETNPLVNDYQLLYSGNGGIQKAVLGLSYKLPFDVSFGATLDYYNGQINHSTKIVFDQEAAYKNAAFTKQYSYSGIGYTFGLISSDMAPLIGLESIKDLRFGITYTGGKDLSTDTLEISTTLLGDISTSTGEVKTSIPNRFGAGISFKWTDDYLFQFDYVYQPFSKFSSNNVVSKQLRDMMKISAGVEYRNPDFRSQSFWEQVMLRGGLSYEQTQYTFNGKGIDQLSVYAGFSMPLSFDNTLDFAFQYGKRGTMENNLIKENIYKFSITLSIGELWFIRQDR